MPDGKNEAKNSTMNLTIDMGNTRVKYAVFDGGTVVSDGCSEEFDEAVIDRILAAHPGITQAIVATTRGPVDDTVALVRRRIGRCLRLSPQLPLPIRNGYTTPETLGEDRLAAAVGAASLYPGRNLLIVDFGTAITIDQVSADGVFRGGNISPGVQMRFRALHDYTAALPLCESCEDQTLLGRSTVEAIRQGVMNGIAFGQSSHVRYIKTKRSFDICYTIESLIVQQFSFHDQIAPFDLLLNELKIRYLHIVIWSFWG